MCAQLAGDTDEAEAVGHRSARDRHRQRPTRRRNLSTACRLDAVSLNAAPSASWSHCSSSWPPRCPTRPPSVALGAGLGSRRSGPTRRRASPVGGVRRDRLRPSHPTATWLVTHDALRRTSPSPAETPRSPRRCSTGSPRIADQVPTNDSSSAYPGQPLSSATSPPSSAATTKPTPTSPTPPSSTTAPAPSSSPPTPTSPGARCSPNATLPATANGLETSSPQRTTAAAAHGYANIERRATEALQHLD